MSVYGSLSSAADSIQRGLTDIGKGLNKIADAVANKPAPVTHNIIFNVSDNAQAADIAEQMKETLDEASRRSRPLGV